MISNSSLFMISPRSLIYNLPGVAYVARSYPIVLLRVVVSIGC
jgi:hypothetical protein